MTSRSQADMPFKFKNQPGAQIQEVYDFDELLQAQIRQRRKVRFQRNHGAELINSGDGVLVDKNATILFLRRLSPQAAHWREADGDDSADNENTFGFDFCAVR